MDLFRRSRRHKQALSARHNVDLRSVDREARNVVDAIALKKRLTADQVLSLENSARASAIRAASELAASKASSAVTTTQNTATTAASTYHFSNKYGNTSTTSTSTAAAKSTVTSSAAAKTSTATSSTTTSTSTTSTTSTTPTSTRTSTTTSSSTTPKTSTTSTTTQAVQTITRSPTTTSSSHVASGALSSAQTSASSAAAAKSTSTSMSNGAVAGVVVGALAGIVVLAAVIGWFYRKYASRSYSTKAPWSKIDDDDITPFPATEKFNDDDIYGPSSAPVIGSRRALALARQNNFNDDGTMRPQSDFVGPNHAGFGAGSYGAYPQLPSAYAFDPQGRPYQPDAGRAPMPHVYSNVPPPQSAYTPDQYSPTGYSSTGTSPVRSIPGHGFPEPVLAPHALGRPAPPQSNAQLSQLEDYDLGGPSYDAPEYTPHTASTGEWTGDVKRPLYDNVPPMGPEASSQVETLRPLPPTPPQQDDGPSRSQPGSLPPVVPMSPFMSAFDINRRDSAAPAYEDEQARQKRMYTEVADAAGVREPPTPKTANDASPSTVPAAPEPMPSRVPSFHLDPPRPYVHGQPLSPLTELSTPQSSTTARSSRGEVNPYERTLLASRQAVAPPYSASTTGATGLPSPHFPPPSPGGMSVPGSISDSPQRWDRRELRDSAHASHTVNSDDAYDGI